MRAMLAAVLVILFTGGPVQAEEPPASAVWSLPETPALLPSLTLARLSGGATAVPDSAGQQPFVLHFWATWCAPCLAELPALERLAARLGSSGVRVLAISEDRGGADDVQPYLDRHAPLAGLDMRLDPKRSAARALAVKMLPTTIVVGADGREIARLVGSGAWDTEDGRRLTAEAGR